MKMYAVAIDTLTWWDGVNLQLLGVYDSRRKAKRASKDFPQDKKRIVEVEVNTTYDLKSKTSRKKRWLGGYID